MQDSDFRYSLNQNPFPEYYNLKTEPVPQEDHDLDHGSLLIHEDEVSQAEVATYSIKGLDELDIPPEKQEIIKNANFFKHLSLSFYPKDKIRTEGSLEPSDLTLKNEDNRLDNVDSFRKTTHRKYRLESPHSNDFSNFIKSAKKTLKFNTAMNKTTKLNIMLNETPSQLDPSSSQITPKNFQIRKTFVKSPREKKQFDPITRNIYSPKTIISPKSQLGQSYLPVYTNDSSLVNGSEHNMTDTNLKGGDKNPIAVLLSKKTQNPQMVSVAALKLHLKDKEANLKSARKISFSKLSFKMNNDPSPRVSMPNRLEENQSVNTQRPHLHVAIPEFNMPKKEVKTQNSVLMNEPLISPKRMRDQLLLIKKK